MRTIENDAKAKAFVDAVEVLCKEHGFTIEPGDPHGGIHLISKYDAKEQEGFRAFYIYEEYGG